jgi:hypothetical protein
MIEKFDPFDAFGNKEEKKEELLYIEPFEIPNINRIPKAQIDTFEESYMLKSFKIFRKINTLDKFIPKNINLN